MESDVGRTFQTDTTTALSSVAMTSIERNKRPRSEISQVDKIIAYFKIVIINCYVQLNGLLDGVNKHEAVFLNPRHPKKHMIEINSVFPIYFRFRFLSLYITYATYDKITYNVFLLSILRRGNDYKNDYYLVNRLKIWYLLRVFV